MTQHPPITELVCPRCRATNGVPLTTGDRLCLQCQNEWNPRAVADDAPADPPEAIDLTGGGFHTSQVTIAFRDPDTGEVRSSFYTHVTTEPHTVDDALTAVEDALDKTPHYFGELGDFVEAVVTARHPEDNARARDEWQTDTADVATIGRPECTCRGYDPADPAGHGDTSEGCPRHDPNYVADDDPADDEPDAGDELAPVIELDPFAAMIAEARAKYVGARVTLGGEGELGTVIQINDTGESVIELDNGELAELLPDEYELVSPPMLPAEPSDELVAAIGQTTLTLAALVLRAGVAAITDAPEGQAMAVPPTGWLPDDAEVWPIVEQGAAYAVAVLIHAFAIDPELVASMAANLTPDTEVSEPESEPE